MSLLCRALNEECILLVNALYAKCHALYSECPYYLGLYMQSGLLCRALYAECPYYLGLYMQSVLLFRALYAECPYYLGTYMQSVLII